MAKEKGQHRATGSRPSVAARAAKIVRPDRGEAQRSDYVRPGTPGAPRAPHIDPAFDEAEAGLLDQAGAQDARSADAAAPASSAAPSASAAAEPDAPEAVYPPVGRTEPIMPPVEVVDEARAQRAAHAPRHSGKVNIPRAEWGVDYNRPSVKDQDVPRATFGDASRQGAASRPARFPGDGAAAERTGVARVVGAIPPVAMVALFGFASAAVVAWGNPTLWMTSRQEVATHYADGIDARDYAFITQAAGAGATEDVRVLGEYQAISQSGDEDRASNLSLAAVTLDGTRIDPGQTLSLNELLGDTARDMRYKSAPLYNATSVMVGRGGGVDQVVTAFYIAALKANLEVIERNPHTIVVDYAPIGLDACLVYGEKDLVVRNNSTAPVFVRASALGQTVNVRIYGAQPEGGVTYDATSKITDRYENAASQYFGDPASLGIDPDTQLTFYNAESYRVKYQDGVMQESTLLASDTYRVATDAEAVAAANAAPADGGADGQAAGDPAPEPQVEGVAEAPADESAEAADAQADADAGGEAEPEG